MVDKVTPEEVKERLDRDQAVHVIDIRQRRDYEAGHVPGAVNIPFHRFAEEIDGHEWGDEIVVVCPRGNSSLQAARLLESYEGIDEDCTVANLEGGYEAWDFELEVDAEKRS